MFAPQGVLALRGIRNLRHRGTHGDRYPLVQRGEIPSRLDVSIDHSVTESSADTTASSVDIGGIGAGGRGVATNTRVDANRPVPRCN